MKTARLTRLNRPFSIVFGAVIVAVLAFAPASIVRADEGSSLTGLLGQLNTATQAATDPTLKSLGEELAATTKSLSASLMDNPELQTEMTSALQSLLGNQGPEAVAAFQKLSAAKLTPGQLKIAKDFGHVGSAYLVQKNLGSLAGSESDVARIVTSLREGKLTAALPAIQKVSKNANLTPAQKDLLTSMADKFAPGAKQAGEAISNGLKSLPGFGK